jgi:hypothetical protein
MRILPFGNHNFILIAIKDAMMMKTHSALYMISKGDIRSIESFLHFTYRQICEKLNPHTLLDWNTPGYAVHVGIVNPALSRHNSSLL